MFDHCCTTPLPTNGVGNIDANPKYAGGTGPDFRLSPGSPCIDAGTNLTTLAITDFAGLPRILDGNYDGVAQVDIGAYEYNPYRFLPLQVTLDRMTLVLKGEPGKTVRVDQSRDLLNWETLTEAVIPGDSQLPLTLANTNRATLFYRAARVP